MSRIADLVAPARLGRDFRWLLASVWGVTAPFWFGFAGSAVILALIWRSLLQIAHDDENLRAGQHGWPPPRARGGHDGLMDALMEASGYESWFVSARDPASDRALWIRHTRHRLVEGPPGIELRPLPEG